MRYFIPDIRIASELPRQTCLQDKLGGVPWGVTSDKWPTCSNCGKPQSLLAQFVHHPSRLDLGREGRALLIFQCGHDPGFCPTWEGGAGANGCFILEPEEMFSGLAELSEPPPLTAGEVRVVQWFEKNDDLTTEQADAFFDDEKWHTFNEVEQDNLFLRAEPCTRLGGVPHWIQSSKEAPGKGWRFVGQLDSLYRFLTAPQSNGTGFRSLKQGPDNVLVHFCDGPNDGPNFGDAGMGYIFVEKDGGTRPRGWFFWQCS